jgi:hypothetical protein
MYRCGTYNVALPVALRRRPVIPFPARAGGIAEVGSVLECGHSSIAKESMMTSELDRPSSAVTPTQTALLPELVAHLRQNREQLREDWARRITNAQLLTTRKVASRKPSGSWATR